MTYAFTHMENFLLLLLLLRTPPPTSRPISQPRSPYPSLKAQIPVLRPKSLEAGIGALGLGFGPQDWNLGLEAGIWASRLRYGPRGWDMGVELRPLPCSLPELQSQPSNAFATFLSTPKAICLPKVVNINGYSRKNIRLSVSVSIRNWIVVELWLHVTCILCKFANV